MNTAIKFAFATALALSSAVPALAAHSSKMSPLSQHRQVERTTSADALDARAYAPTPIENPYDFGIGSQR